MNLKKTFWEQIQEKQEKHIQENLNEIAEEIKRKIFDEKTYEQGLADAWEIIKKISFSHKSYNGALRTSDMLDIFGTVDVFEILKNFTATEAIAKIKAYEDKQNETKGYEQGLADAWEMIKKLFDYGTIEIEDIFGENLWIEDILNLYCYDEVKSKIKKYKKNQKLIVGDEVEYERDNEKLKGIIIEKYSSDETFYTILGSDGNTHQFIFGDRKDIDFFNLTGRHFPQVDEMIKAMKEE